MTTTTVDSTHGGSYAILIPINQRTADESRGKRQANLVLLVELEKMGAQGDRKASSGLGLGEQRRHPPTKNGRLRFVRYRPEIKRGVVIDV